MMRSRNPRKSDRVGTYRLRERSEYRRRLLAVDFLASQECALNAALLARLEVAIEQLSLPQRHLLIAELMIRDGVTTLDVAERCLQCGALLELPLGLEAAIHAARPVLRRGFNDPRLRLPTTRDIEQAKSAEELVAMCSLEPIEVAEAEHLMQEADPLGWIELSATCCMCGSPVQTVVDLAARWLVSERQVAANLFEDIHTLARNYHWTEKDILELSESSRRQYLAMCRSDRESGVLEQNVYV